MTTANGVSGVTVEVDSCESDDGTSVLLVASGWSGSSSVEG